MTEEKEIKKEWKDFFKGWSVTNTVKIQYWFIKEILKVTDENSRLLELGAGSGYTSVAVRFSNRRGVITSDLDSDVLQGIRSLGSGIDVRSIDMFDIGLPDGSLDCIFHQGVLEHFSDEQIVDTLREQGRVAKWVMFDIPNGRRFNRTREHGDERFMFVRHWKKLIKRAGLKIERVEGRRIQFPFRWLPAFMTEARWFRKLFGTSSIFVCRSAE